MTIYTQEDEEQDGIEYVKEQYMTDDDDEVYDNEYDGEMGADAELDQVPDMQTDSMTPIATPRTTGAKTLFTSPITPTGKGIGPLEKPHSRPLMTPMSMISPDEERASLEKLRDVAPVFSPPIPPEPTSPPPEPVLFPPTGAPTPTRIGASTSAPGGEPGEDLFRGAAALEPSSSTTKKGKRSAIAKAGKNAILLGVGGGLAVGGLVARRVKRGLDKNVPKMKEKMKENMRRNLPRLKRHLAKKRESLIKDGALFGTVGAGIGGAGGANSFRDIADGKGSMFGTIGSFGAFGNAGGGGAGKGKSGPGITFGSIGSFGAVDSFGAFGAFGGSMAGGAVKGRGSKNVASMPMFGTIGSFGAMNSFGSFGSFGAMSNSFGPFGAFEMNGAVKGRGSKNIAPLPMFGAIGSFGAMNSFGSYGSFGAMRSMSSSFSPFDPSGSIGGNGGARRGMAPNRMSMPGAAVFGPIGSFGAMAGPGGRALASPFEPLEGKRRVVNAPVRGGFGL